MSHTPISVSFSLHKLQEDIIAAYLIGKPIIKDISSLRIPFKFREDTSSMDSSQHSEYVVVVVVVVVDIIIVDGVFVVLAVVRCELAVV